MSANPFDWARNPSPPDPSPHDCCEAERKAWQMAARLSDKHPDKVFHVWKVAGEFITLPAGERPGARAKDLGAWQR